MSIQCIHLRSACGVILESRGTHQLPTWRSIVCRRKIAVEIQGLRRRNLRYIHVRQFCLISLSASGNKYQKTRSVLRSPEPIAMRLPASLKESLRRGPFNRTRNRPACCILKPPLHTGKLHTSRIVPAHAHRQNFANERRLFDRWTIHDTHTIRNLIACTRLHRKFNSIGAQHPHNRRAHNHGQAQ